MSATLVEQQIRRFLETAEPEAICVSGAWGVGKTFLLNYILKAARDTNEIRLKDYSYVSLFGVNSLEEVKYAIFENRIPIAEIGQKTTITSLERNARKYSKVITGALASLPKIGGFLGAASPLLLLTISEQIVCIDDLERKGANLQVRDVLGLVTFLKEQRNCKVILLSNTDGLAGEDKKQFETHLEKVVEEVLVFDPSPTYCAKIALEDDSTGLRERCIALGISNIRVIKRIERLVQRARAALKGYGPEILTQTVQTLALVGWIKFSKEDAPPLELVRNPISRRMMESVGQRKEDEDPREAAWHALIDSYGFGGLDEFDQVLVEGVNKGFFDEVRLRQAADDLTRSVEKQSAAEQQRAVWRRFHDSFDGDEKDVGNDVFQTVYDNMQFVEVINLYGAMTLMKELDRHADADRLMDRYIELHKGDRRAFDIERGTVFADQITDPDFIRVFAEQYASVEDTRDPISVMLKLAEEGGNENDYRLAATVSVEDLVRELQKTNGEALARLINAGIGSDRVINARPSERELSAKMKAALGMIGDTSRLNALRVRKFGVGPLARGAKKGDGKG